MQTMCFIPKLPIDHKIVTEYYTATKGDNLEQWIPAKGEQKCGSHRQNKEAKETWREVNMLVYFFSIQKNTFEDRMFNILKSKH